jgi:hypothetical protein
VKALNVLLDAAPMLAGTAALMTPTVLQLQLNVHLKRCQDYLSFKLTYSNYYEQQSI